MHSYMNYCFVMVLALLRKSLATTSLSLDKRIRLRAPVVRRANQHQQPTCFAFQSGRTSSCRQEMMMLPFEGTCMKHDQVRKTRRLYQMSRIMTHSSSSSSSSRSYSSTLNQSQDHNNDNDNDNDFVIEEEEIETVSLDDENEFDVILEGLNDAQIEAVTQATESITRVVAGPGAGKTRVLTCRIAYLLKSETLHGNDRSRILAVTFTKKASSEMKHRLDTLLREDEDYQSRFQQLNNQDHDDNDNDNGHSGDDDDGIIVEEIAPIDAATNKDRVTPILSTRVTMGTFHSICAKILRWHGNELSALPSIAAYLPKDADTLDSSFAIIDQTEQIRIVNNCLTEAGIDLKSTSNGRSQDTIRPVTILNAIGQFKSDEATDVMSSRNNNNNNNDDDRSTGRKMSFKVRRIAEEIYPRYRKTLISQNSLDFDDLILMARDLLKSNPEVRERMQKRWNHILVDEFQDTSEVQLDLIRLLTTSSLLVVGDGDQSIYSWRGAHAER